MRHTALLVCALSVASYASSGALPLATESAPIALMPRWAEPASSLSAAHLGASIVGAEVVEVRPATSSWRRE